MDKQTFYLRLCATIFIMGILTSLSSYGSGKLSIPKDRIMTFDEFKYVINNNNFLQQEHQTINDQPLDIHEIKMIKIAIKDENSYFGGEFDQGRDINKFTGNTLLVGGGKRAGMRGENDGKTILIDVKAETTEIEELIKNLRSDKWTYDPYTGEQFETDAEKETYIKALEHKKALYKEAFSKKNKDILDRYYTLNIERLIQPDMLASITSETDMSKIPDNKFMHVEFESVSCDVFLNPKLYPILARITKPKGTIKFSVSNVCRRLMVPVIQSTKFGEEFTKKLKEKYTILKAMHPTYHRITIEVTNK